MAETAEGLKFGSREFSGGELGWLEGEQGATGAPDGVCEHSGVAHAADLELAAALRRGEEAAYERLLRRFEDPIHSLVYRLLHRPAETDDVTQEVFLKVFRGIGSFRGASSLKTWMYRIAVNEARNHLRKFARRSGREVGLDDEACEGLTWEQVIEDQHGSPFDTLSSSQAQARLEDGLARVKPVFREALVLRDVEQLSYLEIAAIVGENPATVKTRILRGRRALRLILAETEPGTPHAAAVGATEDGERS